MAGNHLRLNNFQPRVDHPHFWQFEIPEPLNFIVPFWQSPLQVIDPDRLPPFLFDDYGAPGRAERCQAIANHLGEVNCQASVNFVRFLDLRCRLLDTQIGHQYKATTQN